MDASRWRRVKEIAARALELTAADRPSFVRRACGDDADTMSDVLALLDADQRADDESFLRAPEAPSSSDAPTVAVTDGFAGRVVGPYRLVREIARGGMGAVFLAERQDREFRKRVALKLVQPALAGGELLRRFRAERQILASLEHPHIARLLDGGTTEDGAPYFVMEYVEGRPIHEYCDRVRLGIRRRLELFCDVCDAVQYAHGKLVVHRDIKPGNILVTRDGQPRLLDFGIAKLLDRELASSDTFAPTTPGFLPLTPQFASPEQVRGEPVTTASDVYSLGVLLYLLLSGALPYRVPASLEEAARIITRQEPPRPSAAVRLAPGASEDGALPRPAEAGAARGLSPERLRRTLAGDLDNIVLTALAKEPERRYGSAQELGEEIRRYLGGLPVRARRDTWSYRAGKFVGRHRWGVAAASLFAVALIGFSVALSFMNAALVARGRAEREARARAEATLGFLRETIAAADPIHGLGRQVTVVEVLDRAVGQIDQSFGDRPRVKSAVQQSIGSVYESLGRYAEAEALLTSALALTREQFGGRSDETATLLHELARLRLSSDQFDEAERLSREALELRRALHGDDSVEVAESLNGLGTVLYEQERYDEAERSYRDAQMIQTSKLGPRDPRVIETMTNLASLLSTRGQLEAAAELDERIVELARSVHGDRHYRVSVALNNLAEVRWAQGDLQASRELLSEALGIQREALGISHPSTTETQTSLGIVLRETGDLDGAEALFTEALELRQADLERPHESVARILDMLGMVAGDRGDLATAEAQARRALEIRRTVAPGSLDLVESLNSVAIVLEQRGAFREAEPLYDEALNVLHEIFPEPHMLVGRLQASRATCVRDARGPAAAVPLYLEALATLEATVPDHWWIGDTRGQYGATLLQLGRHPGAEPVLVRALGELRRHFPDDHMRVTRVREWLDEATKAQRP